MAMHVHHAARTGNAVIQSGFDERLLMSERSSIDAASDAAIYRVCSSFRKEGKPNGYQQTLELVDDASREVLASWDQLGPRPLFDAVAIVDAKGRTWRMQPNRKIMPSRWTVDDPDGRTAVHFDQNILGKLTNPLYRVALCILDDEEKELYRLVDPRTNVPDRIFGAGPDDWVLVDGGEPVAKLVRLPRPVQKRSGLAGALRALIAGTDPGVVSAGGQHVLAAPIALGMMILFKPLTDISAG
jgi:hypothetical protein